MISKYTDDSICIYIKLQDTIWTAERDLMLLAKRLNDISSLIWVPSDDGCFTIFLVCILYTLYQKHKSATFIGDLVKILPGFKMCRGERVNKFLYDLIYTLILCIEKYQALSKKYIKNIGGSATS